MSEKEPDAVSLARRELAGAHHHNENSDVAKMLAEAVIAQHAENEFLRTEVQKRVDERDEARASLQIVMRIESSVNRALNDAGVYCAITFAEGVAQIATERDEARRRVYELESVIHTEDTEARRDRRLLKHDAARAHEAIGRAGTDYPIDIAAAIDRITAERDEARADVANLEDMLRVSEEQNDALGDANVLDVELSRIRELSAQRLSQANYFLAQRVAAEAALERRAANHDNLCDEIANDLTEENERLVAACESMVVECGQVQIKLEEAQAEIATARDLRAVNELQREVRESRLAIAAAQKVAAAYREVLDAVDYEARRIAICRTCTSSECQIRETCTSATACRSLYMLARES